MNYFLIFVLIMIFADMIGDDRVRGYVNIIWIIFWVLFVIFLYVHDKMDKKGMFLPKNMYKKRDKGS